MNRIRFGCIAWVAVFVSSLTVAGDEPTAEPVADLARPVLVMAGAKPIEVDGFAAPFFGDFDGDGKADLLVGQYDLGRLRIYRNRGTNARPLFDTFEWFTAGGQISNIRVCCQIAFTPQLVDFDGDGRTDILTGSGIAGEVFFFRRKLDGSFDAAEVLENAEGEVQMYANPYRRRYNVTACAYDWDDDGDNDLVLGMGRLNLLPNLGSNQEPRFDNGQLIECEGEPILAGLGSIQMADWDGDGLADLVTGRRRDVVWYRNIGEPGQPKFQSARLLVPAATTSLSTGGSGTEPALPHAFCVADFNDDGRLDLLLGDRFRIPVENGEVSRESTPVDSRQLELARQRYFDLTEKPSGEGRQELVQRYRELLQAWGKYETFRLPSLVSSGSGYHRRGRVWYFERIEPKNQP